MIGTKQEAQSWRERAMTRDASSNESQDRSVSSPAVEFKKAPLETSAWDPYEVWLTRVKLPRDARSQK
jgi:hypothetical protein